MRISNLNQSLRFSRRTGTNHTLQIEVLPMIDQIHLYRGMRILVMIASLVIIIQGVNHAQSILVIFFVSTFLAVISRPMVIWLEQKRIPSVVAVLTVMAGMITLLLMVGAVVAASLNSFSVTLPFYQTRIQEEVQIYKSLLAKKGIGMTDLVLLDYVNPMKVMSLTAGMVGELGSMLSNIVLILLTVTFILLEASSFPEKLRAALGNPQAVFPHITRFVGDIKRYMIIKTVISLTAGIFIWIWLSILGVEFPILWAFLAFLLHYVPNLGFIIAAVPAVLIALIRLGIGSALFVAAGYLAVNFILGNVIEPRLMGRRLGISTLAVFLSLIVWGSLLGPIGVILCIPFTMALKSACECSEETRWIAILLGPEPSAEKSLPISKSVDDIAS